MRKTMVALGYAFILSALGSINHHAAAVRLTLSEIVYHLPGAIQDDGGWSPTPSFTPNKYIMSAEAWVSDDKGKANCTTEGLSIGGYHTYDGYAPTYKMHHLKPSTYLGQEAWRGEEVEGAGYSKRVRAQLTEAWGTLVCRGTMKSAGLYFRLCSRTQASDADWESSCAIGKVPGEVREITHVDVNDVLDLAQIKGTWSLVSGPGIKNVRIESAGGVNRIRLYHESGKGDVDVEYNPETGVISWDFTGAKAGKYTGHATATLDYL